MVMIRSRSSFPHLSLSFGYGSRHRHRFYRHYNASTHAGFPASERPLACQRIHPYRTTGVVKTEKYSKGGTKIRTVLNNEDFIAITLIHRIVPKMNFTAIYDAFPNNLAAPEKFSKQFQTSPPLKYVSISILAFSILCVLNWFWTYGQRKTPSSGRGPPMIPHWVPWLGNAISFSKDFDAFDSWVRSTMPPHTPYTVLLGGQKLYYVNSPRIYEKAVQKSKQLTFDPLECLFVGKVFDMPQADMDVYEIGLNIGRPHKFPSMTPEQVEEARVDKHFWKQYGDNLFGDSLNLLGNMVVQKFTESLDQKFPQKDTAEWTTFDMVDMQKELLFNAASDVLFGCWRVNSGREIWRDFWGFEDGFMGIFYDYPKIFLRKTLAYRKHLLDALVSWLKKCEDEAINVGDDVLWDKHWGSRMQRQRDRITRSRGLSREGRASHHLGLMFALHSNTIPAIIWLLYFAAGTPNLIPRLREELASASAITTNAATNLPEMDATKLQNLRLLFSCYKETLRLIVSSITTRMVVEDVEISGYTLKQGNMLIMPARSLQMNAEHWSSDEKSPSTETFWPERFVEDGADAKQKKRNVSCWRPFGAGVSYCMGRYLAHAEVLGAFAVMITMFDIELLSKPDTVKIDQAKMGRGSMLPVGQVMMRMRRRANA